MLVNPKRIRALRKEEQVKGPVIYWMSRDQRANDNWALLYAKELAQKHDSHLAVAFCLVPQFLGAMGRQYRFLLQGLKEVEKNLQALNITTSFLAGLPLPNRSGPPIASVPRCTVFSLNFWMNSRPCKRARKVILPPGMALQRMIGRQRKGASEQNDPNKDGQSGLSPNLHFGQISAQRVALEVLKCMKEAGVFLEELIVRKELSDNFCYYMYWAKKILEWTASPAAAQAAAIYLNDRYELDGRDPNGYAGIAWSLGGLHDRAWKERTIFGKVRYMSYKGIKSKFDVQAYVNKWSHSHES